MTPGESSGWLNPRGCPEDRSFSAKDRSIPAKEPCNSFSFAERDLELEVLRESRNLKFSSCRFVFAKENELQGFFAEDDL